MTAADLDAIRAGICPLHRDRLLAGGRCPTTVPAPVMPLGSEGECPAAVINGYGVTLAEYSARTPHRWRPVAGTEPLAGWARRGDLVLAYDRTRDRTEVAEVVGKLVERDSATVHWPDRRWSHCRLSDIVALLEPAPGPDRRWLIDVTLDAGAGTWTP